jgi:hypothetical protein
MVASATVSPSSVPVQTIARQPGVGGKPMRQVAPQRLVPTQNLKPFTGNTLEAARTNARSNGFALQAGAPLWTNGVINVGVVNGKARVVGLDARVDTLQLADQMFQARGLTASDRKKELIPGFTVGQYLDWRNATYDFNREESGMGTNRRGLELTKTAELFERRLVNSLNVALYDLPPNLQLDELQRVQAWQAARDAETQKRREGRGCKLVTNFRFSTTEASNTAAAFATAVEAQKNGRPEPQAVVRVEQQVTPSVPYSISGGSQKRGTTKSSETGDGRANTGIGITVQGGTVATANHQFRGVCSWADGQQITATPANGNPVPPAKLGGWYSETRRFFGL